MLSFAPFTPPCFLHAHDQPPVLPRLSRQPRVGGVAAADFIMLAGRPTEVIMKHAPALSRAIQAAAILTLAMLTGAAAETFPYGRELLLDAPPMRGSKKLPVLDIGDAGTAEIELWCDMVKAQFVVAGNTLTIIPGEKSGRACAPERTSADDDLVAALVQATNWRMQNSVLVLTGGRTLRFRVQTN
jgi:heat shock protein HslJ